MRATTLLRVLLGLQQTRVLAVHTDEQGLLVDVAPTTTVPRCALCRRKARHVHDRRQRLWRHLDLCGMMLRLRYALRRVRCRFCGVVAEWVPWAAVTAPA
jgi:transposase